MAQYTDTDGVSDVGRAYVVSAPEIRVMVAGEEVSVVSDGSVANIAAVAVPFADLTAAATAHNALLAALKAGGVMVADA